MDSDRAGTHGYLGGGPTVAVVTSIRLDPHKAGAVVLGNYDNNTHT